MKTKDFRTKTIIKDKKNPTVDGMWGMAIDIGYSSVKGFAPNRYFCFPYYAVKITKARMEGGDESDTEILYRNNETGEVWLVGASAQNAMSIMDTNETTEGIYARNRFHVPMYKVINAVALGLGMYANTLDNPNGKEIYVQTGLPPAYMDLKEEIIESIEGHYDFSIKIGNRGWTNFIFDIKKENVFVMPQPLGTLLSVSTDSEGNQTTRRYNKANTIICDVGFGTFDVFACKGKTIDRECSYDDLGMKAVLMELSEAIKKEYKTDIPVPCMQKFLEEGSIPVFDRKTRSSKKEPIEWLLKNASETVFKNALERIDNDFNCLMEYNYLILTGGTGSAWSNLFRDAYKNMETIEIVSGNENDDLPYIFANVRGYYMFLYGMLKKMSQK